MAVKEGRTRVQVTFGDEVLRRLDEFCDKTGMTRSSFITYTIATTLDQYERLSNAAAEGIKNVANKAMEDK